MRADTTGSRRAERRSIGRATATLLTVALGTLTLAAATMWTPAAAAQDAPVEGAPADAAPEGAGGNWRQVDAGATTTCAVSSTRRLFCWGYDGSGLLGNGGANTDSNVPVEVAGGGADWDTVSVGDNSACARRTTGRLFCWGPDTFGSLGNGGANTPSNVPVEVTGGATDWTSVSTNGNTACAVKTTGRLFCWGEDELGGLGNGRPNTPSNVPVEVAGGATNWASVAVSNEHTCARKTTGRLFCWGRDEDGNVGDGGRVVHRSRPTAVAGNSTKWAQLSAGYRYTCAVKTSGRVSCWGWNFRSALGAPGNPMTRHVPTEVIGATANWSSVAGGSYTTCGRRVSGRLYCWGDNSYRTLGNPNQPATFSTRPVRVAGGITDWTSVAVGGSQACAIRSSGALYCWGFNYYGQVGNGQTGGTVTSPVPVVG